MLVEQNKLLNTVVNKVSFVYESACMSRLAELIEPFGYRMASRVENKTINGVQFNIIAKVTRNVNNRIPISPLDKAKVKGGRNKGRLPTQYFAVPTTILIGECTTGDDYKEKFEQLHVRVQCVRDYYNKEDIDILLLFFGQKLMGSEEWELKLFTLNHSKEIDSLRQLYENGQFLSLY